MDNKQRLATAHILHSQALRAGAPHNLLQAFGDWISDLTERNQTGAHVDEVSVSDHADVKMVNVRPKN